jgi:uncharacterized repeat protein (TIGR04076 family)
MNRRDFLKRSGTGLGAGVAALSLASPNDAQQLAPPSAPPAPARPAARAAQLARARYEFEVEIVEGQCGPHKAGQKFRYPEEKGKICPWLMDSMNSAIRVLEYGGTMPWLYEGTPYQKVIDPDGLTTEFIRCPDPSRVVVAKIARRRV